MNMKRRCILPLSLILALSLIAGCSDQKVRTRTNGTTGVADLLQSAQDASNAEKTSSTTIETVPSETPSTAPTTSETTQPTSTDGIDIDLSVMSATAVYAEVLSMVYEPERYKGKTVKMTGSFASFHDESTDKYYFACIIKDATACCSQGIEFDLKGDHKYPDDYPEEGAEISVIGTFDTYEEGNALYLILRQTEMV